MLRTNGKARATLRALALAALVVGLAAAGPEKRSTITNVTLQEIGATTQLYFNADGPVKCESVTSPDPLYAIVDVKGANHTLPASSNLSNPAVKGFTADIWHTEDGTPVTRLTIALAGLSWHWIEPEDKGVAVMVEPKTSDVPPSGMPPVPADPQPAIAQTEPSGVSESDSNSSATWGEVTVEDSTTPATEGSTTTTTSAAPANASTANAMTTNTPTTNTPTANTPTTTATASLAPTKGSATPNSDSKSPAANATAPANTAPTTETAATESTAPESSQEIMADDTMSNGSETEMTEDETVARSPVYKMLNSRPANFEPQALAPTDRYARSGARVSLDIQGADIRTVMRSLAEYSGTNIVVGREVQGSVTVNLTEVPWIDALNTICRTQGLGWVEEEGIIRIETLDNLRKEDVARSTADRTLEDLQPMTTQIVRAVYATATELKPAIEKTLTARGHVEVDPRTNSLVITDVSRRVSAAVEMVQHLDSRTPQIEITAKLVDVDARFTRELGINWTAYGLHSDDGRTTGDIEVTPTQIIDPAANVRFGLVRSWGTFNAMLTALEQDNKADIISNPRITTVNNREARILVGRKIPLIVLDEAGNAVTQLTTIGITLRVTPHINDDERITLDLHPEVSDLASQATVQGGIIINTSEADTRVIVDDGETAVIGGLIRSNTSKLKRGVPYLKDIPILGFAFSSTSEVKEKRELLIFITPRIITNWAQTN